ncbi:exopolysaccharide biosynthesis polyprenyl glycosylphosphotransferase [Streptomyces sp. NPDC047971]|uniref:exopolysaccharide biosynthesis polyprenyl glycosylphosphotransferase n=1 Tax=Streptomyces sp. NPDC047971 TaxID=3154499 RepID=UPI0033D4818D
MPLSGQPQEQPGPGGAHRERRRRKPAWYRPAAVAADAVGALVGVYAALRLAGEGSAPWCAAAVGGVWVVVRGSRMRYAWRELGERGGAGVLGRDWVVLLAVLVVVRAAAGVEVPVLPVLAGVSGCLVVTAACRHLTHRHLVARRRAGRSVRRVLVIGEAPALGELLRHLARRTDHEFVVVGMCPIGDDSPDSVAPVLARLEREAPARLSGDAVPVLAAARALDPDLVFVMSGPSMAGERLRRLSWAVHEDGRPLVVVPGLTEVTQRRVGVSSVAGLTLLHVAAPVRRGGSVLVKGVTDLVGAALLLVLLAPALAVVALAVRLDSPGTVLHRQTRVGLGGRQFRLVKFRTMVTAAEQMREELARTNEHDGLMFKIRRDPRITRVGRVLRRFSLDELPQLYNVLRGHMSLVGPRPPLPSEVAQYTDVELRRLSVKPGLTGLWQVSGRSDLSWDETVALDLRYVDNWSPGVDFGILRRTVRAVIEGNGAY